MFIYYFTCPASNDITEVQVALASGYLCIAELKTVSSRPDTLQIENINLIEFNDSQSDFLAHDAAARLLDNQESQEDEGHSPTKPAVIELPPDYTRAVLEERPPLDESKQEKMKAILVTIALHLASGRLVGESLGDQPIDFVQLTNGDLIDTDDDASPQPAQRETTLTLDEQRYTPSGERYVPRTIAGHHDIRILEVARQHGMHVGLYGPPASGKTTMTQVAFPDELVTHVCNGETSVEDLCGKWQPHDGGYVFHKGPLTRAMEAGVPILLDELPRAPHETQAVLMPVMDHRRQLDTGNSELGDNGIITAREGFMAIIAYNPDSGFGMPDALQDRVGFTVEVPTVLDTAEELGVPEAFVRAARALQEHAEQATDPSKGGGFGADGYGEAIWVPSLRALLDARDFVGTLGLGMTFAAKSLISSAPDAMHRPLLAKELARELGNPTLEDEETGFGLGLVAQPDRRSRR